MVKQNIQITIHSEDHNPDYRMKEVFLVTKVLGVVVWSKLLYSAEQVMNDSSGIWEERNDREFDSSEPRFVYKI